MPWGEALLEAREKHLAVIWTIGNLTLEASPTAVIGQPGATKNAESGVASRVLRSSQLREAPAEFSKPCPRFKDGRGCTQKQRDCPEKQLHTCSMWLGSGMRGAFNHGRVDCPDNPQRRKKRGSLKRSMGSDPGDRRI